jgi:hypothetical protein
VGGPITTGFFFLAPALCVKPPPPEEELLFPPGSERASSFWYECGLPVPNFGFPAVTAELEFSDVCELVVLSVGLGWRFSVPPFPKEAAADL